MIYSNLKSRMAVVAGLALVCVFGGCNRQPYISPDRLDRGLVVLLTGIEGRSLLNEAIAEGLDDGGVDWAIEIKDWTSLWGMLVSLRDEKRNREVAGEIAARIERYQAAYPDRPVMILGHSGGGGMAVYTAEKLTNGKVQGVLLLNGAISKDYRLMRALRKSEQGLVNFYSPLDMVVRFGTLFAGTMDSQHSESAGSVGFEVPTTLPKEYDTLYQIGWNQDMVDSFHIGNHFSSASTFYASKYIAPLILSSTWDKQFVDFVKTGQGRAALAKQVEERIAQAEEERAAEEKSPGPIGEVLPKPE
ncbi:MAG: alpha/beta hydrolase [Phycisphaerales bacterium]|nr:alpha/beta hydrolase [Phycisphaerales bacterium]MBT7171789.1 alpha/beta hydrolase [Phycisphaerales bacterium]